MPKEELQLCCLAEGLVGPGVGEQVVGVEANGIALDPWRFTLAQPRGRVQTLVPRSVWARERQLRIVLRPERPTSPRAEGWSSDDRQLGVALRTLQLRPQARYAMGQEILFTAGAPGVAALWSGWSEPDAFGTRSVGSVAELLLSLEQVPEGEVELCCWAEGLVGPAVEEQVVGVEANGIVLDPWRFTRAQRGGRVRTLVPPSVWTRERQLRIVLRPERPTSPRAEGWSSDDRQLGVALWTLQLRPQARYAMGQEILFTAGAPGVAALWSGWSEPDAFGTRSVGSVAELLLSLEQVPEGEVELCCWVEGLVGPAVEEQVVGVEANGIVLDPWRFTRAQREGRVRTLVPPSVWTRERQLRIVLRPERPTSPRAEGWSSDDRQLGVALRTLQLRPQARYAIGQEILFTAGAPGVAALWSGWSAPEAFGAWSVGPIAELSISLEQAPEGEVELYCWAEGLVGPGVEEQVVRIEANGIALDPWRFTLAQPSGPVRTPLPPSVWTRDRQLRIVLRPERPTSPRTEGWSSDDRQLGVALRTMQLRLIYPLVTIVTPSYNQGEFIRATIESVLSQDYPNIEYIVMDGGSTDETINIVREYEDRLTFISESDLGQSHAINKGFKMARGEIVSWLNSDDIILPGAVSRAVKALQRRPSLGAVYGEGYLIDRKGEIKKRFPATESFNLWKLIHVTDYILQQTVYFRREVFEKVGFINEQLNWGMDWDLLIRIGKRYEIGYIPEYMGCLREYETAKSFSGGHRRFRELARIMREHGGMRYPPGFFLYGLDTYQAILRRYLPVPVARLVTWTAFHVYARIVQGQGLYADGWAGKQIRYMLPEGTKTVLIKGHLPDIPALVGQRLRIICNGVFVLEQAIPQGEFQLAFDCTESDQPLNIEIRALKSTKEIGKTADRRRIAYRLTEIICAECDIDRAITENSSRPHSPVARWREWRTQDRRAGARS